MVKKLGTPISLGSPVVMIYLVLKFEVFVFNEAVSEAGSSFWSWIDSLCASSYSPASAKVIATIIFSNALMSFCI